MIKILLIEDEPFWAKEIEESFEKEQFVVTHLDSVQKAVNYIEQQNEFDIVLLDLCLPDSSNPYLTMETIIPLAPYSPIIIITSMGEDQELCEKAYSLNVQEFLSKSDIQQNSLISLVNSAIKRHKVKIELEMKKSVHGIISSLELLQSKLLNTEKMLIDLSLNDKR